MTEEQAIEALLGMAHEHRMRIFKMLMKRGPSGMPAGMIAEYLGISRSNVSFHLTQMDRAGLLTSRREFRNVFYAVSIDGVRQLMTYLTEDCCDSRPELCGLLVTGVKMEEVVEGSEK